MNDTTIVVHQVEDSEPEAIVRALMKANQYIVGANLIGIYCFPRRSDEWLEYAIRVEFRDDCTGLTIGMVQRKKDAEYEFHS